MAKTMAEKLAARELELPLERLESRSAGMRTATLGLLAG